MNLNKKAIFLLVSVIKQNSISILVTQQIYRRTMSGTHAYGHTQAEAIQAAQQSCRIQTKEKHSMPNTSLSSLVKA